MLHGRLFYFIIIITINWHIELEKGISLLTRTALEQGYQATIQQQKRPK